MLRDLPSISLADTLLQKMDGISGWAVFWKNAIGLQIHQTRSTSDRESIEKSIRCLFEECIGKFPDVKTPTSAVHLFNCMSGLLQTVGKYSQQVGWEMSAITVDLCSSTLKRTDSKSVLSELCSNSEVVKSAVICCFWVAVCAFDSTQGSTIASCLDILFEESLLYANSNGDDSLGESAHEVASFYANMGLMEVLSTFGSTLAPVHDRIFQHLTSVFSGGGGNSSIGLFSPQSDRFCGFLFGLGCKLTSISQSLLFAEDVSPNSSSLRLLLERLARLAIEWVKEAVLSTASTPPPMSLSAQRNIGAAVWVLVALLTSCSEDHCGTLIPNLNLSSTEFDSLIDAIQSLKKRSWDSDDLSALLACADMHILNCLADNDPDSLIKSHLLSNMRDSKSTLLVESPYLLGFPNLLSSETENIQASFSSLGDVLESLWSAVPEARSSRAASHVLGSIISYYLSYDSLVEGDDIPASQINAGLKIALEAQSLVITTSSSSSAFGTSQSAVDLPKDLRRLNTQSSFLKAVFDTLTLETKGLILWEIVIISSLLIVSQFYLA